ncbi:hypothetical protein ACFYUJ_33630 [Streptomyces sp. NPDC004520]|uniref:hypothetical protein n=1 Tax=Streptomyces sp. NPDC004520 TaxID=3364702 RepID=UPI0036C04DCF
MGADIHGFIECRVTYGTLDEEDSGWHAAIDLDLLYGGRSYDAFGCLFGVRNRAGFRPLAEGRGLPPDVTSEVRRDYESDPTLFHSASWIGWEELTAVDGDEAAPTPDARVREYRDSERLGRMTRREAVHEDGTWDPVWATMKALADVHGPQYVRLVVWFDN